MKFVIFADKSYNYIKPISNGLHRTLLEMGHSSEIFYDGIYWLNNLNLIKVFVADVYRFYLNKKYGNKHLFLYRFINLLFFFSKKRKRLLKECDCIIVVNNCPSAFKKCKRLDYLRKIFSKPIVNYDFHYLPNQGWWKYMYKDCLGLERFDWYLPVGLVTEFPVPTEIPKIYSCIGMNVNSDDLYPEQKDFFVLLDFPRSGHEQRRKEEKQLLESMKIKYIELNGRYTTEQIRSIYRKTSVYLLSFRESFGLPIVELQLCGAKIFTPYAEWVPAHCLNKDIHKKIDGHYHLGNNFVVYHDEKGLKNALLSVRKNFNASANVQMFKKDYPLYDRISQEQLNIFISKINTGLITCESHLNYKEYNSFISKQDDYLESDRI